MYQWTDPSHGHTLHHDNALIWLLPFHIKCHSSTGSHSNISCDSDTDCGWSVDVQENFSKWLLEFASDMDIHKKGKLL